jgi:hypothetical protein
MKFCSDCGGKAGASDFTRERAAIYISVVPVVILSFLDWAKIPDFFGSSGTGFNVFSLWNSVSGVINGAGFSGIFDARSQEFDAFVFFAAFLLWGMLGSFALMLASLIFYRSKSRAAFAFFGFGSSTVVSLTFIIGTLIVNGQIQENAAGFISPSVLEINLTAMPFLTLMFSVLAIILFTGIPAAVKKIWHVLWAPLLFLAMQVVMPLIYIFFHGIIIIFGLIADGTHTADEIFEIFGNDPERLLETVFASFNLHVPLILSACATFLFLFLILRKKWKAESFWNTGCIKKDPLILFMCGGLGITVNLFMVGFVTILPMPPQEQPFDALLGDNLLLMIVSLGLVAPFIEEIVFRGIVQKRLIKIMTVRKALIMQAFIFGFIHLNLFQSVYTFFVGLLIGVIYLWYDSVWVPAVMHITFNSTSVILSHAAGGAAINPGVFMLMAGGALLVSAGLMAALIKKRPPQIDIYGITDSDDTTPPFIG